MSAKMRGALNLADIALAGAQMNMKIVERKIAEALAEQPAQGEAVPFGYVHSAPWLDGDGWSRGMLKNPTAHYDMPVYTAPPAPAPSVPVGWLYRGGGPRPVSDEKWEYWHGPDRPVLAWNHQEIKPVYADPPGDT